MPKFSKKTTLLIIGVILLVLFLAGVLFIKEVDAPSTETTDSKTESNESKTIIRMQATGDWIAHDAINNAAQTESGWDYSGMTTAFAEYFDETDVNFCNLATLAGGEQFGVTGYPIFNAPTQWTTDMNSLGCNLYNTGTNHTNDKGQAPITAELNHIDSLPGVLTHAGANRSSSEQDQVRYFELDGIKFAFVSYSTYSNTPNPNSYSLNRFNEPLVTDQMTEARANADIIIVSMRWGTEYSPLINAGQETAAQKLASLGADIVLGHGQHVLGSVKRLSGSHSKETIVWYGLGNFLNAQVETEALTGCVAEFDVDIASKSIVDTRCLPFFQDYDWSVEDAAAGRTLNRSNFKIMPLYDAAEAMANSHTGTTVDEQMQRIQGIVNQYTKVPVQTSRGL